MHIGIDARPLGEKHPAGTAMYIRNVVHWFKKLRNDLDITLYGHKPIKYLRGITDVNIRSNNGGVLPGSAWVQSVMVKYLMHDKPDIFWGPLHILPFIVPGRCKRVLTIHDLIYLERPETMTLKNVVNNKVMIPTSIRLADVIAADSRHTADDISKYFPGSEGKTKVVWLGVNSQMKSDVCEKSRGILKRKLNIDYPYILTVGSYEPRKNLINVYRAFLEIADTLPLHLVCTGPSGWKTKKLQEGIMKGRFRDRIHLVGYVEDDILPLLYSNAFVFLYPSLYEGFGLPALEAMACGCPVITSNVSSLPEVVGEAGVQVDPFDYISMADCIKRFYGDDEFRREYVKRGLVRVENFAWENTARKMLDIFDGLL